VMKVLPSNAMYAGYAAREANVLSLLEGHPNIIQLRIAFIPDHPHSPPWLVTEFCNAGTLHNYISKAQSLPDLFIWHVFESLVEAPRYSHGGPVNGFASLWDPVSHRDIIPGNILLHKESQGLDPVVKLADWGCAVTKSETMMKGLPGKDLPEQDPCCIPPEGTMGSEAADIYQVGLVIRHLLDSRACSNSFTMRPLRKYGDLGFFIDNCLSWLPDQRPRTAVLLEGLRHRTADLMSLGRLKYEELVM
ncbi:kinase-like protein, partial [Ophiobolus disseminans]